MDWRSGWRRRCWFALCCSHLATASASHKLAGNAPRSRIAHRNDLGASDRRAWKVASWLSRASAPRQASGWLEARRCSRRAALAVSATGRDAAEADRTARRGCVGPESLCPRLSRHSRNDGHRRAPRPQPSLLPPGSFRDAGLPQRVCVRARCSEQRTANREPRTAARTERQLAAGRAETRVCVRSVFGTANSEQRTAARTERQLAAGRAETRVCVCARCSEQRTVNSEQRAATRTGRQLATGCTGRACVCARCSEVRTANSEQRAATRAGRPGGHAISRTHAVCHAMCVTPSVSRSVL
jgi:hypothetical protein